jgi:hypothetical protein
MGQAGAHVGWHFRAPNLTARGPKGGGLLGESHREVGWWWGARDLADDEDTKVTGRGTGGDRAVSIQWRNRRW